MDSSLRVPIVVGSVLTLAALLTERGAGEINGRIDREAFRPEQVRLVKQSDPVVLSVTGARDVVSRYSLELVDGSLAGQRTIDIEFATEPGVSLDGLRVSGRAARGTRSVGLESATVQIARNPPTSLEDIDGGLRFKLGKKGEILVELDLSGKGARLAGKGTAKLVEL